MVLREAQSWDDLDWSGIKKIVDKQYTIQNKSNYCDSCELI